MALMPGAEHRLLTASKGRKRMSYFNRVNLHVAVSEAASLYGYFNKSGSPDSHFYVRKDGGIEQYVDTTMRANADYQGNDATISIETQGGVTNPDGEPWTPAQIESLAQIYAWAVRAHAIFVQVATTSQTNDTSKGLSWHRLGINGTFPALPDVRAGRKQRGGGMLYSTATGKGCPGDAKIRQVGDIFARAQQILAGAPTPPTPPTQPAPPAPAPSGLAVDGHWGPSTTAALQRKFGTTPDGVISGQRRGAWNAGVNSARWGSGGSQLIAAMQRWLGIPADGYLGPQTVRALQARMGTPVDGVISAPSQAVAEMQRRLNAGTL